MAMTDTDRILAYLRSLSPKAQSKTQMLPSLPPCWPSHPAWVKWPV